MKPRNASWPGAQSAEVEVCGAGLDEFGVAINQHVADIGAFRRGGEYQSGGQIGRQILQAVNGEIGLAFDEGDFEFLCEQAFRQAFALFWPSKRRLQFVAGGLDDFQLEPQSGKCVAALRGDQVGLRQRQRAAARGNDDGSFEAIF